VVIHVRGFWLATWLKSALIKEIQRLVTQLDAIVLKGQPKIEVSGVYPPLDIASALRAPGTAAATGRWCWTSMTPS
jgi:hypothetical protein